MASKKKAKPSRAHLAAAVAPHTGGAWIRPLYPAELKDAQRICKDPLFAKAIVDARLRIDVAPQQISGRECADALNSLAAHLREAGEELSRLPAMAMGLLRQAAPLGRLPMPLNYGGLPMTPDELAEMLSLASIIAAAAAKRIHTRSGRPVDHRMLLAIAMTQAMCARFQLKFSATAGPAIDIVNLILCAEISVDQFKRAKARMRKPDTKR